ncbi:UDP-glucose 4-epimerase GalE [Agromyces aurantiacus]|uniref:UDP-glucose 4-epimerase n=1 Tax=Agromyces aurantiacus TaxID=165814 RepID=A0ABV9R895_9MICO|nr:UDP-glucose 4-epimerase GalE [Agromyces aurantiacus]MBM7504172.1 UDP-glucose 4-epimerase [Agromyces aurantiacus]
MRIVVTGGAGYIGSHVVRLLRERGDEVVVVDDLVTGDRRRVPGLEVVRLDLAGGDAVDALTGALDGAEAVIHFAARKQVAESVARPAWYYRQNIGSLAALLEAVDAAGVGRVVFSSSAAVYGATEGAAIRETDPTVPVNPYGDTKLVGERMLTAAVAAGGVRAVSLRYFNVAGAGWDELGDRAVLNLVPMVFERIDAGEPPVIFGDDYPTPDGTCIRDYIHVLDLAHAHIRTLDALAGGGPRHDVFNVGTGRGYSVREMIDAIAAHTGAVLPPVVRDRRPGDPAVVVADPSAIRDAIGWSAERGLDEIVASAWSAHRSARGA